MFFRFSYVDDPQYIPGPFGGVADGGSFQQGIQTAKSDQAAAAYTHVFSPTMVNVARGGFNHLHTTRFGPDGATMGIPDQYNIQGVPQVSENGGLPTFTFGGLANLGSNNYLPSDEISQTLQITDDFTKIYGKHSFKTGIEYQHVKFSTLQPAYSRGQDDFKRHLHGCSQREQQYNRHRAIPAHSNCGDSRKWNQLFGRFRPGSSSNINKTYDEKNYFAAYLQDDWKITPKLTVNLGIRWDYFGPIQESNGAQANFVPSGAPDNKPEFLIPSNGKSDKGLPANLSSSFQALTATDGIAVVITDKYGKGLVQTQKTNFAPRVGFAYQVSPKLVTRGGFGMFYNSFENQGYGPNIGENYPFVFNFNYQQQNLGIPTVSPISAGTPWAGCSTAGPGGTATFESGLSCIPLVPSAVNASGLGLQGLQFDYQTPPDLER